MVSVSAPQSYKKWHYVPPDPGAPHAIAGTADITDQICLLAPGFWHSLVCARTLHLDNLSVAPETPCCNSLYFEILKNAKNQTYLNS